MHSNNIKQFITKVSSMDGKQGKAVILSMDEARGLRDELACMLANYLTLLSNKKVTDPVLQVEIVGGKF